MMNLVIGPDLVIAGSARSGTSYLASVLGSHPAIDPGAVKESNYFSRELWRGSSWYDGLYQPRQAGLVRLDASMSYTYAHFPDALRELRQAAPDAYVVYCVRHPVARALSHYQLHRDYFANEPATRFADAATDGSVYLGASRYEHWLSQLSQTVASDRLLIVPFPVVTGATAEVTGRICSALGLGPLETTPQSARAHRNEVARFRSGAAMRARRIVRRSGAYPVVRKSLGSERLRWLRGRLTTTAPGESLQEALAQCSADRLSELQRLHSIAREAVTESLRIQDSKQGTAWVEDWLASCPADLPGVGCSGEEV